MARVPLFINNTDRDPPRCTLSNQQHVSVTTQQVCVTDTL